MKNSKTAALVLFLTHMSALPLAATTFLATPAPGDSAVNLRQAINDANANPGPDIVQVAAGTYIIENAVSDDDGTGGDLDINDDLTIQGTGSGTTIIDGAGLERVLDVNGSHDVSILDVTVRNGSSTTGGCISGGSGALVLTRVIVRDGKASDNGAAEFPETTFETWLTEFFTPGQMTDPNISGPDADPDGDGQDNTDEYLADTNPSDSGSQFRICEINASARPCRRTEKWALRQMGMPGFIAQMQVGSSKQGFGAGLASWRDDSRWQWD